MYHALMQCGEKRAAIRRWKMRLIYADPPYIGQAKKRYNSEEVDHVGLLEELRKYDGWALSCSSSTLAYLLTISGECRIGAWVKPFCSFKPNVNPAYSWEPVLYKSARRYDRKHQTIKDHVISSIVLKKGLVGAKPEAFAYWIFGLLQAEPEDSFVDLFPGTGVVGNAWKNFVVRADPLCPQIEISSEGVDGDLM
jgi:hypothetical protein